MTEEKLSSIKVANMDIMYWFFPFPLGEGDGVKGVDGEDRFVSQLKFHFIKFKIYVIINPLIYKSFQSGCSSSCKS